MSPICEKCGTSLRCVVNPVSRQIIVICPKCVAEEKEKEKEKEEPSKFQH